MNIGFVEARKSAADETERPFDCFLFHDVDLLPEDDRNDYGCPMDGTANQLVSLINIYNYTYGGKKYVENFFEGSATQIVENFHMKNRRKL